jgi:tRNA pseudouridine38-40 synthase
VQNTIEEILKKILGEKINIIGSGRTDAYVHAERQTFNFKTNKISNIIKFKKSFSSLLPDDIQFISIKTVDSNFHAQHSAKEKNYKYLIYIKKQPIHMRNFSLFYDKEINIKKIKQIAKKIEGKHNFLSFSTSELEDTIREVKKINIKKENNLITINIFARGFLRSMCRMIIGFLLDYNEGKKTDNDLSNLFNNPKKGSVIRKVKGSGLYLKNVKY